MERNKQPLHHLSGPSSHESQELLDDIFPVPEVGDTLIRHSGTHVRINLVSEKLVEVEIDGKTQAIPLQHFSPVPGEANTWELVGISSTDYERW